MSVTLTRTRSTTFAPGGDVDGDGRADAGDILRHTLIITNTGTTSATNIVVNDPVFANSPLAGSTATGTINVSPVAFNDSFNAVGNTLLEVGNATSQTGPQSSFAGSVLSNDVEFFGDTFQISAVGATSAIGQSSVSITSVNGGAVTMITSGVDAGSFTYVSAAGFEGTDTFTYTIRDKGLDGIYGNADDLTSTATVTITVGGVNGQVWYVDSSAGAGGTGTSVNPFNSMASFAGAGGVDGTGDYIYVKGAATGNLTMETNEHLVGTGTALVVNGVTLAAAGSNSSLTGPSGFTLTLGSGDEITGIGINGGAGVGAITGTGFGTLTVSNATINTGGPALQLSTGGFAGTGFTSTTSGNTSAGTANVFLTNVTGSVNLGTGSMNNTGQWAIQLQGGNGSFDYNGTITHSGAGAAITINNKTGGTVQFDGSVSTGAGSQGVSISNSTGTTTNFNNGLFINTTATNATGFSAVNGGTINVIGGGNTINAGQGTTLFLQNTTIGSGNLTFQSLNSSGGTATGIYLDNTGTLGGLHVTGTGSAGSGGTIANKTGADNSITTGIGIYLNNTKDVQLDRMALHDFSNFGIRGFGVNGFSLANSTVNGTNGTTAGNVGGTTDAGEGSIFFGYTGGDGLSGVASFTNDTISGGYGSNLAIRDTATGPGDLHLFITNDTFGQTQGVAGNQNLIVETRGAGTHTFASVTGSTFAGAAGDQINFTGQTGTIVDTTITGNTLTNNHPVNIGGGGVTLATQGVMRFLYDNNTETGAKGSAITLFMASGATSLDGTISNSTIGNAVAKSGSDSGNGIFLSAAGAGTATLNITGNTIQHYNGNAGIYMDNTGGSYTVNATITNNTVKLGDPGAFAGLALTNGANLSGDTVNVFAKISNNDFSTGDPNNANDIIIGQSGAASGHTFKLAGATAADVASLAAVQTFLKNSNNLNGASAATVVTAYSDNGLTSTAFQASASAPPLPTGPTAPLIASAPPPADPGPLVHTPPTSGPAIVAWDPAAPPPVVVDDGVLTQAELNLLVGAAIDRWAAAGATADEVAAMRAVYFTVENLSGLVLGTSSVGHVTLDSDAAGFNWFIDPTPGEDSEFAKTADGLRADANSIAGTRIDLLTTIMHELGHQIGLGDAYLAADRNDVMYATIDPGERRLPSASDALLATGHANAGLDFLLSPVNLGTLPAGQTVTIVWDSTVSSFANRVIPTFGNFSTVTYDDGASTGLTANSNTETLGPGGANAIVLDSLTLGDLIFNDVNRNGVYDAGTDVGVSGVTLTLYADANGNGVLDGAELTTVIATTTTLAGGAYSFTGLAPGDYVVSVDASNFTGGGALVGKVSSTGSADPDDNVNNDDNGVPGPGGTVIAAPIRLDFNSEPTAGANNNTNNTLDLGFFAPNQAPSSTLLQGDSVNFTEGGAALKLDSSVNATISDPDSADFAGGTFTVSITANKTAGEDQLGFVTGGNVTVAGNVVSVGGTSIGTFSGGGAGGGDLVFTLNSGATAARIATLIHELTYLNSNPDNPSGATRTITYTLVDGDGTAAGGTDTLTLTSSVTVTPVDDAPVAVPDPYSTNENAVLNVAAAAGVLANDTDVDGGPKAVASVNGNVANVGVAVTLASGAKVTLNADGSLTYDPNHKFDYLISPATAAATGAVNSSATDTFTYALNGGSATTVTVTINGVDGAGDQLRGNAGDNTITGTGLADYFDLSQGGNDTANGGGGDDSFYFGAAFSGADTVDGGAGTNDQIGLQGNYTGANALVLGPNTITNVEVIAVLPGFSYSITTVDANVGAGQVLKIFAGNLGVGDNFTFNGAAETNGSFTVYGGQGTDIITTGAGDDGIYFGPGRFDPSVDRVDGGAGTNDQLALDGNYTLTLDGVAVKNIEVVSLLHGPVGSPNTFNITTADSLVGAGQTMTIWGASLDTSLTFNGSAESNGNLKVYGGHAADTITTGAGNDWIFGGLGADVLNGGAGSDTFRYEAVNESTGSGYDQIVGFVSGTDKIDLPGTVAAVDPTVNGGALNTASFNADLGAAIGAGQLHAGDAVLFHPTSGTLAGTTFLIVDANGIAGYQADQDYVIQLVTPPPALVPTDFV